MATFDCDKDLRRTVPIARIVNAAIIDRYEDIGKTQELYFHWAARGFKKINRETLKIGLKKVTLTVNRNTNTATLPLDFHEEHNVYVIVCDQKIPLRVRPELVDKKNIEDIPCEDRCPKCKQETAICNDLTITQEQSLIEIGNHVGIKTITKRLYPDGSYWLEITYPTLDIPTQTLKYITAKELITCLDMKACGCVDLTPDTIEKIKCHCPDVWCNHIMPCGCECNDDYGGYRIFEESGLIQFDTIGKFKKVYLEYWGFLPKKNGQYHVPEVAFETLVEWTKYKAIRNKRNIPKWERDDQFDDYKRERRNMEKVLGRVPLSMLIEAAMTIPKFDLNIWCEDDCGCPCSTSSIKNTTNECVLATPTLPGADTSILPPPITPEDMDCCTFREDFVTSAENVQGNVLTLSDLLKDRRILAFDWENNINDKIITEGIPGAGQILYDDQNATFTKDVDWDLDQRGYVVYTSKIS